MSGIETLFWYYIKPAPHYIAIFSNILISPPGNACDWKDKCLCTPVHASKVQCYYILNNYRFHNKSRWNDGLIFWRIFMMNCWDCFFNLFWPMIYLTFWAYLNDCLVSTLSKWHPEDWPCDTGHVASGQEALCEESYVRLRRLAPKHRLLGHHQRSSHGNQATVLHLSHPYIIQIQTLVEGNPWFDGPDLANIHRGRRLTWILTRPHLGHVSKTMDCLKLESAFALLYDFHISVCYVWTKNNIQSIKEDMLLCCILPLSAWNETE